MNIIDQLDATRVTRGTGGETSRNAFGKFSVVCNAITTSTLSLARRVYNRYAKLKTLFIHEETLGGHIEMHGETRGRRTYGVRQPVGTIENISLLILDSLCLSIRPLRISPRTTSQPAKPTAPTTGGETRRISFESVSAGCFAGITYGVRR